jgi:hypothetical protein
VHVDRRASEPMKEQDRRITAARGDRMTVPAHGLYQGTQHAYLINGAA